MNKPLEGIIVVDFSVYAAGPSGGKILADWGADVIKVEPLTGEAGRTLGRSLGLRTDDGSNPMHDVLNGNKRSLALNMKTEEGKEIMDRLLAKAHIFISNYRLKALRKMGLDYESMSARHPHIIWGFANGYGMYGPDADKAGFDAVAFWSRSGALRDLADKTAGVPMFNPWSMGDVCTGFSLACGVIACLPKQAATGKGEKVTTSLYSTAIWLEGCLVQSTWYGDEWPKSRTNPFSPLSNCYRCKDDRWVYISCFDYDRYHEPLFQSLEREDLLTNPLCSTETAMKQNIPEVTRIMDDIFASRTFDAWHERLLAYDVPHDRVLHFKDVSTDQQAIDNSFVYTITDREGKEELIPATPIQFGGEGPQQTFGPLVGEHTAEILGELGYSDQDIKRLEEEGAIVAG